MITCSRTGVDFRGSMAVSSIRGHATARAARQGRFASRRSASTRLWVISDEHPALLRAPRRGRWSDEDQRLYQRRRWHEVGSSARRAEIAANGPEAPREFGPVQILSSSGCSLGE